MKTIFAFITAFASASANVATFEGLPVNAQGYYNANGGAGSFVSDGITFTTVQYGGFNYINSSPAYPANRDTTTAGFGNAYSPFPGVAGAGDQFANSFDNGGLITLPVGQKAASVLVTNTTYAALSMRDGDSFGATPFGGADGSRPDFFKVTFTGHASSDPASAVLGKVEVFLGDYRFADHDLDYILDHWISVDLSGLGVARFIRTDFAGSQENGFGLVTPTYVALDNLSTSAVPEPAVLSIFGLAGVALLRRRHQGTN